MVSDEANWINKTPAPLASGEHRVPMDAEKPWAVVGIGSNLGDRYAFISAGAAAISRLTACRVESFSTIYETEAVGPPQPDFLNAALRVTTSQPMRAFLEQLKGIEARAGRGPGERWGPRCIDLDILWWSGGSVDTPGLRIPHPHLTERTFALAPLLDVAPELGWVYAAALARLGGAPKVWTEL